MDTARECFSEHEVLPYPRGWSPPWRAGTAEGWRGCVLGLGLRLCLPPASPVCPPLQCGSCLWAQSCPMAPPAYPAPFPLPALAPASVGSSSPSGITRFGRRGLSPYRSGSSPEPSPAPPSHHVRSFFKYGFYFEHLCDLSMKKTNKQQNPQTFRLFNDCKLFKYICPWNKNTVSGVCFLHSLCSARGKEAGGATDDNWEEIWGCCGSSGFRLSWGQPLP